MFSSILANIKDYSWIRFSSVHLKKMPSGDVDDQFSRCSSSLLLETKNFCHNKQQLSVRSKGLYKLEIIQIRYVWIILQ